MNSESSEPVQLSAAGPSNPVFALIAPVIATVTLFISAAATGGDVADRGLLPLVRFIGLLMLVLGLFTALVVGRYCSYSRKRWVIGQVAAVCIGLGAGYVWSATAFGAGFVFFMIGSFLVALLIPKEMEKGGRLRRRQMRARD